MAEVSEQSITHRGSSYTVVWNKSAGTTSFLDEEGEQLFSVLEIVRGRAMWATLDGWFYGNLAGYRRGVLHTQSEMRRALGL